jgi:hypothetical protein
MNAVRRSLAVVSACGFTASVVAYVESYFGASMEEIVRSAILLHIGVFILLLPMFAVEYSGINDRSFFWKGFAQGRPKWAVSVIKLLGLFFAIHFVLFLVQSHAASPEIINGQYVLNSHGKIVKVLAEPEYLRLKGAELRLFATGWMFFYFVPAMYWWFPRSGRQMA